MGFWPTPSRLEAEILRRHTCAALRYGCVSQGSGRIVRTSPRRPCGREAARLPLLDSGQISSGCAVRRYAVRTSTGLERSGGHVRSRAGRELHRPTVPRLALRETGRSATRDSANQAASAAARCSSQLIGVVGELHRLPTQVPRDFRAPANQKATQCLDLCCTTKVGMKQQPQLRHRLRPGDAA
jgi:hypothetical protein